MLLPLRLRVALLTRACRLYTETNGRPFDRDASGHGAGRGGGPSALVTRLGEQLTVQRLLLPPQLALLLLLLLQQLLCRLSRTGGCTPATGR